MRLERLRPATSNTYTCQKIAKMRIRVTLELSMGPTKQAQMASPIVAYRLHRNVCSCKRAVIDLQWSKYCQAKLNHGRVHRIGAVMRYRIDVPERNSGVKTKPMLQQRQRRETAH